MENGIKPPANRAVRRAQAAQGLEVSPKGTTRRPPPISWVKVNNNSESVSFGPWVVTVTQLPSMHASQPPNYSVEIHPTDVKAEGIHDEMTAKVFAVRLLARMLQGGLKEMIKYGVLGVRGDEQPGPGEKK